MSMKMVITAWAGVRVKGDYQDMIVKYNQIIQRSLPSITIDLSLEPFGLSRYDGKWPDIITYIAW